MTPEQLAAIKARADAATPGPWESATTGVWSDIEGDLWVADTSHDYDAAFIAHAREDVPALLAEVDKWRARAEKAEAQVAAVITMHTPAQRYVGGRYCTHDGFSWPCHTARLAEAGGAS
jgi:hypothetical protein